MRCELQAFSLPMTERCAAHYGSKAALDYALHEKLVKKCTEEEHFSKFGRDGGSTRLIKSWNTKNSTQPRRVHTEVVKSESHSARDPMLGGIIQKGIRFLSFPRSLS